MVRWFWQNRLVLGVTRFVRLFLRWILVWLGYLARTLTRQLRVSRRMMMMLIRPRDPNNVFLAGEDGSLKAEQSAPPEDVPDINGERRKTLLWAAPREEGLSTSALSLWQGERSITIENTSAGAVAANRRYAYIDVLATQIKRISTAEITELETLVQRLARKWLDVDEQFKHLPRRNRLNIGSTLRHNIPRYAGRILNFKWATKERPVPQFSKPARILIIGDVSHSMVHYVTVVLYFFHLLNFRFQVDSFIFSENATHASPFLNGLGTFTEKVQRLVSGARSWNAGTRFGSALEEIATQARVDENTYVIIATDGKVALHGDESTKIERYLKDLQSKAKQVIFLTPSAEFNDGARGKTRPEQMGSFKYGFYEIPIFNMGPPLWYGQLAKFANRVYLVRTVQDLIDLTEDLIMSTRG